MLEAIGIYIYVKIYPLSLNLLYIEANLSLKSVVFIISGTKLNDLGRLIHETNEPLAPTEPSHCSHFADSSSSVTNHEQNQ